MFDTVQLDDATFRVDMVNALRISALRDYGGSAIVILPTLADLPNNENFNQIQSVSAFAGHLPSWESPTSIRWSYEFANTFVSGEQAEANWAQPAWTVAEHSAHESEFNIVYIQSSVPSVESFAQSVYLNSALQNLEWVTPPTGELIAHEVMRRKPCFEFFCRAVASKSQAFAAYVAEHERHARELFKRLYLKFVLLGVVAKSYRSSGSVTVTRDQVVHLEMITLAKEHQEAPGSSAVGQMLITGGTSWKRWRNRLSSLFSKLLRRTHSKWLIAGGLTFANAESLSQY
jgi:hypothetical protein